MIKNANQSSSRALIGWLGQCSTALDVSPESRHCAAADKRAKLYIFLANQEIANFFFKEISLYLGWNNYSIEKDCDLEMCA